MGGIDLNRFAAVLASEDLAQVSMDELWAVRVLCHEVINVIGAEREWRKARAELSERRDSLASLFAPSPKE